MSFNHLVATAKTYFPQLHIKYKNESWLMKLYGFFNPSFMEQTSIIGNTIYYPSKNFVELHESPSSVILIKKMIRLHYTTPE